MATEKSVMAVIRASRPSFRNAHDKVAFAVHAAFISSDYLLTATGNPAFSETALSSTSTDEVGIERWNELQDDYAFVYFNPEKGSKKVLVKCLVMNDKLLVAALADGASEPIHLEIKTMSLKMGGTNYSGQFKNLDKLVKTLDKEILSKLDGSSDKPTSLPNLLSSPSRSQHHIPPSLQEITILQMEDQLTSSETRPGQRQNLNEPGMGVAEPQHTQTYPAGLVYPPVNPIGGSDLFPGPGAGMYPTRSDFGSGSMLLGPNDPRWFGGVGGDPSFPGGQPGVPPGARFDPYGPPGVPGLSLIDLPGGDICDACTGTHLRISQNRHDVVLLNKGLETRYNLLCTCIQPRSLTDARMPRRPGGGTHPDLQHFGTGSDF
ncbi:putative proteasome inhibitor [Vitis vinifera]|uniref:Putative proteasome inhibitor n=1 Tax=Vitis vinifera TaxID=29760 RepID=A0A438JAE8_VITVI|nr:putative proteasome inhibitor [Vitis vinifera]